MNSKVFSFDPHPELKGRHALFSPSQSAWLRYDEEKIIDKVRGQYRTALGTEIHEYASIEIPLFHKKSNVRSITQEIESYIYNKYKEKEAEDYGLKLIQHLNYIPKEVYETVKFYINDGIGYKMTTEQPVKYSDVCFGHMDSVCFDRGLLRIHDLKTGSHEANMEQLVVYAALFCLEYGPKYDFKPNEIDYELRLYQWDGIVIHKPTIEDILPVIDSVVTNNKIASDVEKENK